MEIRQLTAPFFGGVGSSSASRDFFEDWLFIISAENNKRLKNSTNSTGRFGLSHAVEFIFVTCDDLHLPLEVHYTALLLFESFMDIHFNALYTYTLQQSEEGKCEHNWSILEDKMCSQVTLRAVSCVQVAAKLHSIIGLPIPTLKELLRKLGYCYTTDNILNSELRILKTLNFKVNFLSPLDYVEILLKLLEDQNLLNCDANHCFHYCVYVLDLVLLNKDEIYTKIIEYSLKTTVFDRKRQIWLENDYMILATSVITTAVLILNGINEAEIAADILYKITRVPVEDIADFSTIVVNFIVAYNFSCD